VTIHGSRFSRSDGIGYDRRHNVAVVTELTVGEGESRRSGGVLVSSHPLGSGSAVPSPEWNTSAHVPNHAQLMSCMRAVIIAVVLLGVLALIVWF
jgi:hypothetical protein